MLTTDHNHTLHVHPRFTGLPGIAHGGHVGGLLADALGSGAAEVRLRRPIQSAHSVNVERADAGRVRLRDGETVLAEATARELVLDLPTAPTLAQAREAATRFPGHDAHPYPECYVCGPDRAPGDGLRIFPGSVSDRPLVAAPWHPSGASVADDGSVRTEAVWAAFDCAQLWSLIVHQPGGSGERAVTSKLAGAVERPVSADEELVVFAWPLGRDGDALLAGAALASGDGEVLATGLQTAVVAKWGVPLDLLAARAAAA